MRHRFGRVGSVATLALGLVLTLARPGPPASATRTTTAELAPASSSVPPQLHREGRWLVDQYGRVVTVHGLNLVWKHAPYIPPATAEGFRAGDAQWMRRYGFNGARIGTLWAGVTPEEPGKADPTYLRRWQRVIDLLAQQRIWMQFDFHQDMWHEQYGGEGVPDWAAKRPAPSTPLPRSTRRSRWATGSPRSPRSSTASGRTPTVSSTAGCRPGRSWRSGGRTSRTRWATT